MGRKVRRKFTSTLPPLQSIQQHVPVQILPPAVIDVVPDERCPIRQNLQRYGARSGFHPAHAAIARRLRQVWITERQVFDQVWVQLDGEERSALVACVLEGVSTNRAATLHGTNQPRLMSLLIQGLDKCAPSPFRSADADQPAHRADMKKAAGCPAALVES